MMNFIKQLLLKLLPVILIPVYAAIVKFAGDFPLSQETFIGLIAWAVIQVFRLGGQVIKVETLFGKKVKDLQK